MNHSEWRERLDRGGLNGEDAFQMWSDWGKAARLSDPEQAYLHDPDFNALVKMISAMLHRADFTPSEVRKAAMLACTHFEMAKPPGFYPVIPS